MPVAPRQNERQPDADSMVGRRNRRSGQGLVRSSGTARRSTRVRIVQARGLSRATRNTKLTRSAAAARRFDVNVATFLRYCDPPGARLPVVWADMQTAPPRKAPGLLVPGGRHPGRADSPPRGPPKPGRGAPPDHLSRSCGDLAGRRPGTTRKREKRDPGGRSPTLP